ncbi:MAG: hypothetical protein FJ368_03425 [Pelagibacterales bacterium]|nr:hypothetical protein [Pelagibacterales bacterium]
MQDSENKYPLLSKFLIPVIFLYALFSLANSFHNGYIALLHFTIVIIGGIYLLTLSEIKFDFFKAKIAIKVIIALLLICITSTLLLITNYFSI